MIDKKRYIYIVYTVELLVPIAIIYPYTLPIKFLLLLAGGILFLVDIVKNRNRILYKEKMILYLSILSFGVSIILNIHQVGLRSLYLMASNVVLFCIVFMTIAEMDKCELEKFLNRIATITLSITIIVSLISIVLLMINYTGEYDIKNVFIKNIFSAIGMLRPSDRYGICTPYFYGITNHSLSLGLLALLSIIASCYKLRRRQLGINICLSFNICIQFIMIVAAGMRVIFLAFLFYMLSFVLFTGKKYILEKKPWKKFIKILSMVILMCVICMAGKSVTELFIENHMSLARDFEIIGTEENAIINDKQPINTENDIFTKNDDEQKVPIETAILQRIEKVPLLNKLNILSSGRINIWLTAIFKLQYAPLFGYAINETTIDFGGGHIGKIGLHSEFVGELYVQGLVGTLFNLMFYLLVIYKIFTKFCKMNMYGIPFYYVINSSIILAIFCSSFLGILITYSVSFFPIFMWIMLGSISNGEKKIKEIKIF